MREWPSSSLSSGKLVSFTVSSSQQSRLLALKVVALLKSSLVSTLACGPSFGATSFVRSINKQQPTVPRPPTTTPLHPTNYTTSPSGRTSSAIRAHVSSLPRSCRVLLSRSLSLCSWAGLARPGLASVY